MRKLPRSFKAAAAAFLLVGLLVVVALAARGSHPGGHGRVSQRRVPDQVSNDLLTIIIILYFTGAIALFVFAYLYKSKWQPVKSHWVRDTLTTVFVFTILAVIGYKLFHSDAFRRAAEKYRKQNQAGQTQKGRKTPPPKARERVSSGGAKFDTTLALGLLGLLVVGGALYYVRIRARATPLGEPPKPEVKQELAAAVSDAIEDLQNEPDARRAVVAAYARMERALSRRGWARRPAETPFEYLTKILTTLDVREHAVRELTELFEHAKFSPHPVDDAMKARAISALITVREDLREPEAVAA